MASSYVFHSPSTHGWTPDSFCASESEFPLPLAHQLCGGLRQEWIQEWHDTKFWVQTWITVIVACLSVTMSTSAVDTLQNAITDNIAGVYLKDYSVWWSRLLVVGLNVPCVVISLRVNTEFSPGLHPPSCTSGLPLRTCWPQRPQISLDTSCFGQIYRCTSIGKRHRCDGCCMP